MQTTDGTTDELSFTMGGDKMVSNGENISDCADEWAHASLRKVSILLGKDGFSRVINKRLGELRRFAAWLSA